MTQVADQCHNTLYMRVRNFGSSPPKPEEEEATKTENTELKLATIIPETHKKLDCEEAENPVPQVNPEQRGASGQERAYPRYEPTIQCDYHICKKEYTATWFKRTKQKLNSIFNNYINGS